MRTTIRDQFDFPSGLTYLNCAFMSPLPRVALEAGHRGMAAKAKPWLIGPDDFFREVEETRTLAGTLFGVPADCVAMAPSVSYGMAIAAQRLCVPKGSHVLALEGQFPSNVYPWRARGATRHVGSGENGYTQSVLEAMSKNTAVIALPHCHWSDGSKLDLVRISDRAREVGAAVVLDLTQSLGAMPIDLRRIDPDFVVAAGYKWLWGPYSTAYVYIAERHLDAEPIEHNWINRRDAENFAGLVDYCDDYLPGARRFDVGEKSNFALMPAAKASLQLLADLGIERIAAGIQEFTDAIATGARARGFVVPAPDARSPHIIGLRHPRGLPDGLTTRLADRHVYVSGRGDAIRVSPHLYNSVEDVDRLFAALDEALG